MPEIVLTEEQARILAGAGMTVVVRDPQGAAVGVLDPRDAAIIARAKHRAANPSPFYYTSASVTATLDALQAERDRIGPVERRLRRQVRQAAGRARPREVRPEGAVVNFTVGWDQDAYRELTQLWATAPDPAAIRVANTSRSRTCSTQRDQLSFHP